MNSESNSVPVSSLSAHAIVLPPLSATQPFYWSVRRELWENRSIYIAPLAALDPAHQRITLAMPFAHAAMLLMLTAFLVAIFYCLDALHGERRDRSILFWKSLPVSDRTTVLSKASIPLVLLPLLAFVITVAVQQIMWLLSTAVLVMDGLGVVTLWNRPPLFQMQLVSLYGFIVITLWHAPIYTWLLLVSGWARRATFLWAVLPPLAIAAFERIAFHTSHFGSFLLDRLFGFAAAAFDLTDKAGVPVDPHFIPLTQLAPLRLLSNPGLWVGLLVTAAFLAAAIRLRRYREPV